MTCSTKLQQIRRHAMRCRAPGCTRVQCACGLTAQSMLQSMLLPWQCLSIGSTAVQHCHALLPTLPASSAAVTRRPAYGPAVVATHNCSRCCRRA